MFATTILGSTRAFVTTMKHSQQRIRGVLAPADDSQDPYWLGNVSVMAKLFRWLPFRVIANQPCAEFNQHEVIR